MTQFTRRGFLATAATWASGTAVTKSAISSCSSSPTTQVQTEESDHPSFEKLAPLHELIHLQGPEVIVVEELTTLASIQLSPRTWWGHRADSLLVPPRDDGRERSNGIWDLSALFCDLDDGGIRVWGCGDWFNGVEKLMFEPSVGQTWDKTVGSADEAIGLAARFFAAVDPRGTVKSQREPARYPFELWLVADELTKLDPDWLDWRFSRMTEIDLNIASVNWSVLDHRRGLEISYSPDHETKELRQLFLNTTLECGRFTSRHSRMDTCRCYSPHDVILFFTRVKEHYERAGVVGPYGI